MLNVTRDAINNDILRQSLSADTFEALSKELQEGRAAKKRVETLSKLRDEAEDAETKAITAKNHALAELEQAKAKIAELEGSKMEAAVAQAKSDTLKECFDLVFRNVSIRQHSIVSPAGSKVMGRVQPATSSSDAQTAD